jgi:hypothetical protein
MAETQIGCAVVWGISSGNITTGTGIWRHSGQNVAKEAERVEHKDGVTGDTIGYTVFDQRKTLELTVYPANASGSTPKAQAISANVLPQPGDAMTVTDASDTDINGAWSVVSASKVRSNSDKVIFTVSLVRHAGVTSVTPITS